MGVWKIESQEALLNTEKGFAAGVNCLLDFCFTPNTDFWFSKKWHVVLGKNFLVYCCELLDASPFELFTTWHVCEEKELMNLCWLARKKAEMCSKPIPNKKLLWTWQ